MPQDKSYNERLFEGNNLRSYYHNWRFKWFRKAVMEHMGPNCEINAIELGCFDGRLIHYFPKMPNRYVGLDADWEGGLLEAKEKKWNIRDIEFVESKDPQDLLAYGANEFNLAASLETLEHINPNQISSYIENLSKVVDGYFFVSVPNEKGIIFLIKHAAKFIFRAKGKGEYSIRDYINLSLGRTHAVHRDNHKGFDFDELKKQLSNDFDLVKISGGPFGFLPPRLSLTVAFVLKSKRVSEKMEAS